MSHSLFIERLRERPLHERHLIMWAGSIALFLLIFWIWLFQLEHQLASLSPATQFASPASPAPQTAAKLQGKEDSSQLGQLFESMKEGTASLFSLFQSSSGTSEPLPQNVKSAPREGSELDQFLNYQPFPKE